MTSRTPFVPLSSILGTPIADVNGAVLGYVTELLVDRKDGRVAYIQFRFASKQGTGEREITIPWSSMRSAQANATSWQLRVEKSALIALMPSR